MQINY